MRPGGSVAAGFVLEPEPYVAPARWAQAVTMLSLGFFPIVAQTLLFRNFMGVFDGGELAVGCFFSSWLLWVAAGAVAARFETRWRPALIRRFDWLPLLYLPAYVAQYWLITHARLIAGLRSYDVAPLGSMVALSFVCNSVVCFLTGFFFALACGWLARSHGLPVARAYVLETLGGFAGGVTVTVLLACAAPAQTVFLWAAVAVAMAVAAWRPCSWRRLAPLVILAVLAISGAGARWTERDHRTAWQRLLPPEAYRGSFATAQTEYLYGEREEQFVVMAGGGVREAAPDTDHASAAIAVNLAQRPSASRVLVVGPGSLALCLRLAAFPHMRRIVWLDPDPDLPHRLLSVLPAPFRAAAEKVEVPAEDARGFVARNHASFDLVLLNLPDPASLVVNRNATREFLVLIEDALVDDGAVSVSVSGGGAYLGSELAFLGASILKTIESVFRNVTLKPGEETWIIASNGPGLTESPAKLRDQFASIDGAAALYPPEGLLSQYLPDRIAFQTRAYRDVAAAVPDRLLLNLDARPKSLLYGLMLVRRRGGEQAVSARLPLALNSGFWIAITAVAASVLLRLVYVLRSSRPARGAAPWPFDAGFLVFSTGLAGMSLSVVLMLQYQSKFGTLYLLVGLVTSLFMLGGFLGSLVGERWLASRPSEPAMLLPVCVLLHWALLAAVVALRGAGSQVVFAALFVLAGFFTGVYFPLGAKRLAEARRAPTPSGSSLEALDTLGGAAGAALTGLAWVPVLGSYRTLGLLALAVAANLPPLVARSRTPIFGAAADAFARWSRVAGYAMFGVGAVLLSASHLVAAAMAEAEGPRLDAAARAVTGRTDLKPVEARLADGATITYCEAPASDDDDGGYVFPTGRLAPNVHGYGGPIELAVYVDRRGALRDFVFLRSSETPAYVARLREWRAGLKGAPLFGPSPFAKVDAVSGATLTSAALLQALERAGHRFASEILHLEVGSATPGAARAGTDRSLVALALLAAGAIALRYRPGVWRRRAFLALVVVVSGWWLNVQYSTHHTMAFLDLNWPVIGAAAPFAVVVLIPVLVALMGNIYCGYLCPFGALQELAGDLRPREWDCTPAKAVWRYGRYTKYLLLFILVALFSWYRDSAVLSADPLITLFGAARGLAVLALGAAALIAGFFYRRFWCRNLCPAGAFLALLGGVNLLKRITPGVRPVRCDMGLETGGELDCLRCDRCRHAQG